MSKYKTDDIKSIISLNQSLTLHWRMTDWCNLDCPYCANLKSRKNNPHFPTEEDLITMAKNIQLMLEENNVYQPLNIVLTGGEVSFFNLPKILAPIKNISTVCFLTNFSNKLTAYEEIYDELYKRGITLATLVSQHNPDDQNFSQRFVKLVQYCKKHGYNEPTVTLLIKDHINHQLIDFYKQQGVSRLKVTKIMNDYRYKQNLDVELEQEIDQIVTEVEDKTDFSAKCYLTIFKDGTQKAWLNINHFTNQLDGGFIPDGFYCTAGMTKIALKPDGNVYANSCYYLMKEKLGNIFTDKIVLNKKPIICQVNKNSVEGQKRYCPLCCGVSVYKKND